MRYQFVDCRWQLGHPERGRELYLEGHIPGASFLDVERELSAPPGGADGGKRGLAGRLVGEVLGERGPVRVGVADGLYAGKQGQNRIGVTDSRVPSSTT